jgi:hypothetical protein
VALVVSACGASKARQIELLFSSTNQNIASLHFSGQQQEIAVTNAVVLGYLDRAFHAGRGPQHELGITYNVKIGFQSGISAETSFYIYEGLDGFAVAIPRTFNDPYYFHVRFPAPIPEDVQRLMWHLGHPGWTNSPTKGLSR